MSEQQQRRERRLTVAQRRDAARLLGDVLALVDAGEVEASGMQEVYLRGVRDGLAAFRV